MGGGVLLALVLVWVLLLLLLPPPPPLLLLWLSFKPVTLTCWVPPAPHPVDGAESFMSHRG